MKSIPHIIYFFIPDVNECLKNPCQNGGSCQNNVGGHSCECKPGFQGKNCENGK
jgi:Notch-like protein